MYKFPIIRNIKDVLPAIQGKNEFNVTTKGDFTFINYNVAYRDTFPEVETPEHAILRECRGIVFDKETGEIVSRRLHKFFNLNEKSECSVDTINLSDPHHILEKIDGSMITFLPMSKEPNTLTMKPATKMGFTDTSAQVEQFVEKYPQYERVAVNMHNAGLTAIFEWCCAENMIVIDYKEPKLTLIAIRNTITGQYIDVDYLKTIGNMYKIPVVSVVDNFSLNDINILAKTVNNMINVEGVVIRFKNGHMVKVKTEWYVLLHRSKAKFENDIDLIKLILDGQIDDIRAMFGNDIKAITRIDDLEFKIKDYYNHLQIITEGFYQNNKHLTRKEFALLAQDTLPKKFLALVMNIYSGKQPDYASCIIKNYEA